MIDLQQFKMHVEEEGALRDLLRAAKPRRIAEFGSGQTTRFWALHSEAEIVTWDNYPKWIAELKTAFDGEGWLHRVDFRLYDVTPPGPRHVEKDAPAWEGDKFDFLFLDGPRSAHPQNFGRSGTFRFAMQHAQPGAYIVWHDANRPHEQEMARKYFRHCARHRRSNVGWCRWEAPTGSLRQRLRRFNIFA
jgi:predicted O-methyltransferase YrrM